MAKYGYGSESAERIEGMSKQGFCSIFLILLIMVAGMASCNAFFDLREAVGVIAPNRHAVEGFINDVPFTPIYRTEKAVYADVGDTVKIQLKIQGRSDTTFIMPVLLGETWRIEANGNSFTVFK